MISSRELEQVIDKIDEWMGQDDCYGQILSVRIDSPAWPV